MRASAAKPKAAVAHAAPGPALGPPARPPARPAEFAQGELFEVLEDDQSLPEDVVQHIAKQLVRGRGRRRGRAGVGALLASSQLPLARPSPVRFRPSPRPPSPHPRCTRCTTSTPNASSTAT
jgi:hypothetical protein